MEDTFWIAAATAFGLVLVLEGLLYALFPDGMRRMMEAALAAPPEMLRRTGLAALTVGVLIVWLVRA